MTLLTILSYTIPLPFLLILFTILLYKEYGISTFFGTIFMLFVCMPIQLFLSKKLSESQEQRLNFSDKRTQLITQLISGIRYLKCSASEMSLMNKINEYRLNELKHVKKQNTYLVIMCQLVWIMPSLCIFIIITSYMYLFNNSINVMLIIGLIMIKNYLQTFTQISPFA
eukprot:48230_1